MSGNYTKAQRKLIREWSGIAYQRELSSELGKLKAEFAKWEKGELDAFELEAIIHKFHNGIARELYNRHDGTNPDFAVTGAVRSGALKIEELPEEVRTALAGLLALATR